MFREMRRSKQSLTQEESIEILKNGTSGVLALMGDDSYPYAVPLSYAYYGNKLIFHCALTGHKLDAIAANEKCSFCVIDRDDIVPEEYTTYYRSVIVFGRAFVLEKEEEKRRALKILADKYSPLLKQGAEEEIEKQLGRVCLIELHMEHISGKAAKELK